MRQRRMLQIVLGGLIVLALAGATPAPGSSDHQSASELRIVFIAYENPDQVVEDVGPVVSYLEEALGLDVKHFVATDYAAVVEALGNKSADVGFMGPLPYVIAHRRVGAYPILGEVYQGKSTYHSRIFVRKDSGLTKAEDLRGKTVAFVDPLSSSGYMYPLDIFLDAKLIKDRQGAQQFFKRTYFAGGDEQAIRAVFNRFVDAAGIGQYAYGLLRPEERDQITAIAESRPIPSHCVVVRQGLERKTVERLQQVLLELNQGSRRSLLKHLYSVDGYVKVTHEDYREVEALAKNYGFLK